VRIAFLVRRQSNYRLLAPVVDCALGAGCHVECWPDYSFPRTGLKKYLFPSADRTPAFQHGRPVVRSYAGPPDLAARLKRDDVDAVVSLTPLGLDTDSAAPRDHPGWVCLQSGLDTFHYASDLLKGCDLLALQSPWWLDWGIVHRGNVEGTSDLAALRAALEPLCGYVGFSEVESARLVDPQEVRRRWAVPGNQPVVVLLPFPQGVGRQTFWPMKIFAEPSRARRVANVMAHRQFGYLGAALRGGNDVDLARSLRRFCDRNDAFLLVKSREKTPIPDYLRELADACIYDQGFYPPTIVEALAIASMCVSYYSLGILEATALGVPHLCIAFDARDYLGKRATSAETTYFDTFFNRTPGGLFEFTGVTRTMSPEEAIGTLPTRTLDDFKIDSGAQRDYWQKFFGRLDGQASVRAVAAIERAFRASV
jgi:hypothetical protein